MSELIYSGDESVIISKINRPIKFSLTNALDSENFLGRGELVALMLLEASFRGKKYRSEVADSWKSEVSVSPGTTLTHDMQSKICTVSRHQPPSRRSCLWITHQRREDGRYYCKGQCHLKTYFPIGRTQKMSKAKDEKRVGPHDDRNERSNRRTAIVIFRLRQELLRVREWR